MTRHFDLAGLIGSRICHDIISPLGAVGNGVELMALAGQGSGPEFDLVRESIESANDRIKFFRVAFGSAAPGQTVARGDLLALVKTLGAGGRLKIDWAVDAGIARTDVKRVLLGILCLEYLMPGGGTITVGKAIDGRWELWAAAARVKDAPNAVAALGGRGDDSALAASEVQFTLLRMESKAQGFVAELTMSDGGMVLRV